MTVNHDAYSVNAGTTEMEITSECDPFWEEQEGGRAGEMSRKKRQRGGGKKSERGIGDRVEGGLWASSRRLALFLRPAPFTAGK